MNVIFMGTPDFAVPILDAIVAAGHRIVLVVTQPDKARGREYGRFWLFCSKGCNVCNIIFTINLSKMLQHLLTSTSLYIDINIEYANTVGIQESPRLCLYRLP